MVLELRTLSGIGSDKVWRVAVGGLGVVGAVATFVLVLSAAVLSAAVLSAAVLSAAVLSPAVLVLDGKAVVFRQGVLFA